MANLTVEAIAFACSTCGSLAPSRSTPGSRATEATWPWCFARVSTASFNGEVARKAMPAQPDAIRALGLKWLRSNVQERRELGRRAMLHGAPTWFCFHRGYRQARARAARAIPRGVRRRAEPDSDRYYQQQSRNWR